MDTRFWGPSGWRLLHSITFAYDPKRDRASVDKAFTMLPFVLPCKYCRASLTEYMEADPLQPALASRDLLCRWLWRIHNQVNRKLRSQKIRVVPDPPFEKVAKFYNDLLATGCYKTEFPGWDFLFSIAELHPKSKSAKQSVPIPGGPQCDALSSDEEKNRWNCLDTADRLKHYKQFWTSIGQALPFPEWREIWSNANTSANLTALNKRSTTIRWLWKLRCAMESRLLLLNTCKYASLCKTLKTHRSGCAKSVRAKTCRKNRSTK